MSSGHREDRPCLAGEPSSLQKPLSKGEFVFRGFTVRVFFQNRTFFALIDTEDGTPFPVVHGDGTCFAHRQSARTQAKTVIRWHIKHGGWRLPQPQNTP